MNKLGKVLKNRRGVTLVELVCVVAMFGMFTTMCVPMISSYIGSESQQLEENADRLDVQMIKTYMAQDVHYAKTLSIETGSFLKITNSSGGTVNYTLTPIDGKNNLVRVEGSDVKTFGEVDDVQFSYLSTRLIKTELSTDGDGEKSYSFNTARWGYRKTLLDFIELEGVFLYADYLSYEGNEIYAESESIYIDGDLNTTRDDLNGGAFGNVETIYVNGDLTVGAGVSLGKSDVPSRIYVNGDMSISGGCTINGDVYISGSFRQTGGGNMTGHIRVGQDVSLSGGPNITGLISYVGTLYKPNWMSTPRVICNPFLTIPYFPEYEMLTMKPQTWFEENGYIICNSSETYTVKEGDRFFCDGNLKLQLPSYGATKPKDVIIASNGSVTLNGRGAGELSGLIFCPTGRINITGLHIFTGVMLTSSGIYYPMGGSYIYGCTLQEVISTPELYPFMD